MTGPIASSSSPLHVPDTQTLNPTHARVRVNAIAKRTLGRRPEAGALRHVRPPRGRRDGRRDPRSPSATAISLSTEGSGDDIAPPQAGGGQSIGAPASARAIEWPREESNLRARIRSPSLYPLSYGAVRSSVAASKARSSPRGRGRACRPCGTRTSGRRVVPRRSDASTCARARRHRQGSRPA